MGRRRKKFWSYVAGDRGRNWVRAFEKAKGGVLFLEWYEVDEPNGGAKRKRASLGHKDRTAAKEAADELAAAFLKTETSNSLERVVADSVTVHQLLDLYLESETPLQEPQQAGPRSPAAAMFERFFPRSRRAKTLNLGDWNRFIRARREYKIGPPATLKRAEKAREEDKPLPPVGDRQIEYDLRFLWAVLELGRQDRRRWRSDSPSPEPAQGVRAHAPLAEGEEPRTADTGVGRLPQAPRRSARSGLGVPRGPRPAHET